MAVDWIRVCQTVMVFAAAVVVVVAVVVAVLVEGRWVCLHWKKQKKRMT